MIAREFLSDVTAVTRHLIALCPDGRRDELFALAHMALNRRRLAHGWADPEPDDPARTEDREVASEGDCGLPPALSVPGPDLEHARGAPGPASPEDEAAVLEMSAPVDTAFLRLWFICWEAMLGDEADPTHGALRFHHHQQSPDWQDRAVATALIGRFLFYR